MRFPRFKCSSTQVMGRLHAQLEPVILYKQSEGRLWDFVECDRQIQDILRLGTLPTVNQIDLVSGGQERQ